MESDEPFAVSCGDVQFAFASLIPTAYMSRVSNVIRLNVHVCSAFKIQLQRL